MKGGPGGLSRGQSTVEFALASVVIVLLLAGIMDVGRAFFYSVALQNAAREGARHGAWFNESPGTLPLGNPYLSSTAIKAVVDPVLVQDGLPASQLGSPLCPSVSDGNSLHNPPYVNSAYITTVNQPVLYICYNNSAGSTDPPTCVPNCWGQDLDVILVMSYGTMTGVLQTQFGNVFHLAVNWHMAIQGHP